MKYFETWLFFSLRSVRFQRYSTLTWPKSFVLMLELTKCDLIKKDFEARAVSVAGIFKFPTLELLVFVVISLE